jgi:hypothetical protein
MGGCQSRNRNSEWGTAYIVIPNQVTEFDRSRITAMLTANPYFKVNTRFAPIFNRDLHQPTDAFLV